MKSNFNLAVIRVGGAKCLSLSASTDMQGDTEVCKSFSQ